MDRSKTALVSGNPSFVCWRKAFIRNLLPYVRSNTDLYWKTLCSLKHSIKNNHREKLSKGCNSMGGHMWWRKLLILVKKFRLEILEYPSYSSDISSSDLYIFGHLKQYLKTWLSKTWTKCSLCCFLHSCNAFFEVELRFFQGLLCKPSHRLRA